MLVEICKKCKLLLAVHAKDQLCNFCYEEKDLDKNTKDENNNSRKPAQHKGKRKGRK